MHLLLVMVNHTSRLSRLMFNPSDLVLIRLHLLVVTVLRVELVPRAHNTHLLESGLLLPIGQH